jgi:hypothetical protein
MLVVPQERGFDVLREPFPRIAHIANQVRHNASRVLGRIATLEPLHIERRLGLGVTSTPTAQLARHTNDRTQRYIRFAGDIQKAGAVGHEDDRTRRYAKPITRLMLGCGAEDGQMAQSKSMRGFDLAATAKQLC